MHTLNTLTQRVTLQQPVYTANASGGADNNMEYGYRFMGECDGKAAERGSGGRAKTSSQSLYGDGA